MEKAIQKIQTEVRSLPLTEGENETGIPYTTAWYYKNKHIQMPKTKNP